MKSKMLLSLVLAASITLGGAAMVTNANFNATATSAGNVFTTGTVQLQRGSETPAQAITMDKLFNASNMGFDKVATTTASINIRGSLPVVLSANILSTTLPSNEAYNSTGFTGNLTTAFIEINTNARWWRQYKMAITIVVTRNNVSILQRVSREETAYGELGYDSFFDVLSGTDHSGSANTTGLSALLTSLGTLQPGDVVTITTKMKLISDLYDGHDVLLRTLTNEQQNIFQGLSLGADVTIIATQN